MRSLRVVLSAVLVCTLSSVALAACPVPGNFVASTTGRLASNVHVARLSEYAFAGSCDASGGAGAVDERFWSWSADAPARPSAYGSAKVRIGDAVDPSYAGTGDRKKKIQGQRAFQKSAARLG